MRDSEIQRRLKSALDQAPIDLLEDLKLTEVRKMDYHDRITEQFPQNTKSKNNSKSRSSWYKYLAIAASFLLVVFGSNFFYQNSTAGELYLDINPSFSIEVKINDRIKNIRPLNYEAYDVLEDKEYKNENYESVIISLIDAVKEKGYLVEDMNIVLVSSKEKNNKEKLSQVASEDIVAHFKDSPTNILVLRQSINEKDQVLTGLEKLLEKIAKKEKISDSKILYGLTLEQLMTYLYSNNINLEDYVEFYSNRENPIDLIPKEEVEEIKITPSPAPVIQTETEVPPIPPQVEEVIPTPPVQPSPPVYENDDDDKESYESDDNSSNWNDDFEEDDDEIEYEDSSYELDDDDDDGDWDDEVDDDD